MAMETRLTQRMSQRVVMTPLLQQAIQLLQLSTLELQEVVQKELLENPLLEEVPVDGEGPPAPGEPEPAAPAPEPVPEATRDERRTDDVPFDLKAVLFDDQEKRSLVVQAEHDDLPFENIVRATSTLGDHLEKQLRFATDNPVLRRIGSEIIGNP